MIRNFVNKILKISPKFVLNNLKQGVKPRIKIWFSISKINVTIANITKNYNYFTETG